LFTVICIAEINFGPLKHPVTFHRFSTDHAESSPNQATTHKIQIGCNKVD
jgi:hypothetical protein